MPGGANTPWLHACHLDSRVRDGGEISLVEGPIGVGIGSRVLLSGYPLEVDLKLAHEAPGLNCQLNHCLVLDLPVTAELLNDKLGIHTNANASMLGLTEIPKRGNNCRVLSLIIRRDANCFTEVSNRGASFVFDVDSIGRRPGVSA